MWRLYYYAGGTRVAEREATSGGETLYYLLGDHLGSTAITANSSGNKVAELRYKAWGESRYSYSTTPTKRQYTGQISEMATIGLYFYGARFYDPYLNRWTSLDSIIPDLYNPLDWDRYSYSRNNPVTYVDPDGHFPILPLIGILVFLATLPGDTRPYDVSPTTAAIGNTGLRMVDPIDAIFTGVECLQGQCSGVDVLFAILPVVNGGLDDLGDAANHLDDLAVKPGTLSNVDARKWYLAQEAKIKGLIDPSLSLEEQAKQAFDLRNQFRTQARNLMADRELAEKLMREEPNLSWEQVIQKAKDKGYSGDEIYRYIIDSSQRSRPSVNTDLGVDK